MKYYGNVILGCEMSVLADILQKKCSLTISHGQARIAVQATNLLQSICRLQYPPKDLARLRLDLFSICRLRSSSASAMEGVTSRCLLEGPLQ